jgi:hypothetical protein
MGRMHRVEAFVKNNSGDGARPSKEFAGRQQHIDDPVLDVGSTELEIRRLAGT